jgi:hypothetical protein
MNLKNIILGVGIVIVFALLLWQGIEAFYPSPDYENFCPISRTPIVIETQQQCEAIGGQWNPYDGPKEPDASTGYCNREFTCRQEYEDARDSHSQVVFYIAVIVGIIALLIGYFILSIEPVGSALIASGIWAFFWGTVSNWTNFTPMMRFVLLAVVFILLIWLAIRGAKSLLPKPKRKKKK